MSFRLTKEGFRLGGRVLLIGLIFAGGFVCGSLKKIKTEAGVVDAPPVVSEGPDAGMEWQEARWLAGRLSDENERFLKDILELKQQLRTVSVLLAQERHENDRLRLALNRHELVPQKRLHQAEDAPLRVTLMDVNDDIKMAVIDAGRLDGIRPGLIYHVVEGENVAARLRVVDVRDRIAGAVIENMNSRTGLTKGLEAVIGKE